MRIWPATCCAVLIAWSGAAHAQEAAAPAASAVKVESYYRIRWGELPTFLDLYRKNHQPLLNHMQELGLITAAHMQEPYTHLTGEGRWDVRVTITYRDADAALFGKEIAAQWHAAQTSLYPDAARFRKEEKTRFDVVEEHWDVVVIDVGSP